MSGNTQVTDTVGHIGKIDYGIVLSSVGGGDKAIDAELQESPVLYTVDIRMVVVVYSLSHVQLL